VKAHARLAVELDGRGHSVVRQLRSSAPLTLVPARRSRTGDAAAVWLVNSAAAPIGGDQLELTVLVGAGARLNLHGVAATLALPGHRAGPSRFAVWIEAAAGARVAYLPEPTVITSRARHEALLHAELARDAILRCREVLVLGREGEPAGRLSTTTHVLRAGRPLLRQHLDIGDPALDASAAYLAGRRVLATEILVLDTDPARPAGGDWWSLTPLAGGGALATALAHDAVTAMHYLHLARSAHPCSSGAGLPPDSR
jgi:urease accessory protein